MTLFRAQDNMGAISSVYSYLPLGERNLTLGTEDWFMDEVWLAQSTLMYTFSRTFSQLDCQ